MSLTMFQVGLLLGGLATLQAVLLHRIYMEWRAAASSWTGPAKPERTNDEKAPQKPLAAAAQDKFGKRTPTSMATKSRGFGARPTKQAGPANSLNTTRGAFGRAVRLPKNSSKIKVL